MVKGAVIFSGSLTIAATGDEESAKVPDVRLAREPQYRHADDLQHAVEEQDVGADAPVVGDPGFGVAEQEAEDVARRCQALGFGDAEVECFAEDDGQEVADAVGDEASAACLF